MKYALWDFHQSEECCRWHCTHWVTHIININAYESWGISTCLDLFITLGYECRSRPISNSGGSEGGLNWRNQDVTASLLYIQTPQWGGVYSERRGDWRDSACSSVLNTIILFCPYIYYNRTVARMLFTTLSRMSFINSLQIVYYTY